MSPKKYAPAGRCIYCGSDRYASDGEPGNLHLEHIIPLALEGQLELPSASCRACERITGQLEQRVLRGSLHGIREHLGLKSREKEGRPATLPVFAVRAPGEKERRFDIPVKDYPTTLVLLHAREAGVFLPPGAEQGGTVWNYLATDIGVFLAKYGFHSLANPALDTHSFMRMIGKIGHAFLSAELGWGNFSPTLPPMILGQSQNFWEYIGGEPDSGPASEELHEIALVSARHHNGRSFYMVRLRLFARLGAPSFLIAAGEYG